MTRRHSKRFDTLDFGLRGVLAAASFTPAIGIAAGHIRQRPAKRREPTPG